MSAYAEPFQTDHARPSIRGIRRAAEAWMGPIWVWAILAAVLIYGLFGIPDFFAWGNLTDMLSQGVPLGLVAIGETLVILTAGIDISVASVVSLGNTLAMGLMNGHESHVWYALLLPLAAGLLVGIANGLIVAYARVPAFIATLGSAAVVQGIVFAYTNYNTYGTATASVSNIGFDQWGPFPVLVVLMAPVVMLMLVLQNRTKGMRHIYAVGGDETAARLAGISAARVKIAAYAACGFFAALGGVALTTRTGGGEPLVGTGYDWNSIAAVVIGGTLLRGGKGGIAGSMVAVVVLSGISNAMDLKGINAFWDDVVQGAIVMLAVGTAALMAFHPLDAWRARVAAERRTDGDHGPPVELSRAQPGRSHEDGLREQRDRR